MVGFASTRDYQRQGATHAWDGTARFGGWLARQAAAQVGQAVSSLAISQPWPPMSSGIALAIQLFEPEADLAGRQDFWGAAMAMCLGVVVRVEAVGILSGACGDDDTIRWGSRVGKLLGRSGNSTCPLSGVNGSTRRPTSRGAATQRQHTTANSRIIARSARSRQTNAGAHIWRQRVIVTGSPEERARR